MKNLNIYDKMEDYFLEESKENVEGKIPRGSYKNRIEFLRILKKKMLSQWSFNDSLKEGLRKKSNPLFYSYLTEEGQREIEIMYYTFKIRCIRKEPSLDVINDYRYFIDKMIAIMEKKQMK